MRWSTGLTLVVFVLAACSDSLGPRLQTVPFGVVPDFRSVAAFLDDADVLQVVLEREDTAGTFAAETTITLVIDSATGVASGEINVTLLESPETFRITFNAIRSSDGEVLFSGVDTVGVTSGTFDPDVIPVTYVGPISARVEISPKAIAADSGDTFTFSATAFDSTDAVIAVPLRFFLVNPADSTTLTVHYRSGEAEVLNTAIPTVGVYVRSADDPPATDTATVSIGVVAASVVIDPGYAAVTVGGTVQLTATTAPPDAAVAWTSRNTGIATVDPTGTVTGVAEGVVAIIAEAGGLGDSALVAVAPSGNAVVSTTSGGRGFASANVTDQVFVDVTVDMSFTGGELLGSYNAAMTWDPAVLQYVGFQVVDFAAPTINEGAVASGLLRFGSASATGSAGQVVVIRVEFQALAAGTTSPIVAITEMSAAQTFTNLINNVTIANGSVTVR